MERNEYKIWVDSNDYAELCVAYTRITNLGLLTSNYCIPMSVKLVIIKILILNEEEATLLKLSVPCILENISKGIE